jgi:hypothetical protein
MERGQMESDLLLLHRLSISEKVLLMLLPPV